VLVVASFEASEEARAAIAELTEALPEVSARFEEIVGDAWRDEWKKYYAPFALTPTVTVRPPWEELPAADGAAHAPTKVLVLEPGRAFGTGLHSTTSLVAEVLDANAKDLAGAVVLDAGCGSGILSLLALVLGAESAVAFDIDPDVIQIVRENAERNGLADRVKAFAGTIADVHETFPWVVANIETAILGPIADDLARAVAPGGHLVLSGILAAEEETMKSRFTSLSRKLELVDVRRRSTGGERAYDKDGWVALHLVAK
jgi:ribosomal protein L11 methyltransferase